LNGQAFKTGKERGTIEVALGKSKKNQKKKPKELLGFIGIRFGGKNFAIARKSGGKKGATVHHLD